MSTKLTEPCPECGTDTIPTDKSLAVDYYGDGPFPVAMWRYHCGCGWIWANALQRQHNATELKRARKVWMAQRMFGS